MDDVEAQPVGSASSDGTARLALYHFDSCPYCVMVRTTIDRLGLDVELRNIHQNAEYRSELVNVRGRETVPVLRVESPDGQVQFIPESSTINRYLRELAGQPDPTPEWVTPVLRFAPWVFLLIALVVDQPYRGALLVAGVLAITARFGLQLLTLRRSARSLPKETP